jgi:hypothetical protein
MADHSQDPDLVIDLTNVRELVERSDIDRDQKISVDDLGDEDWGGGFRVDTEPVVIERGADGGIIRTVPLNDVLEAQAILDEQAWDRNPVVAPTVHSPVPMDTQQREKLVRIMAVRLFKWYAAQPPHPARYNPVYDGIPNLPPGSPEHLQPLPGTKLYPATPDQVLEWLKTSVLAPRIKVINNKRGLRGYQPSIQITRNPT